MAYDEWFETVYKENLELLERVACSFMLKKLGCGMEIYARYADQVSEEIQEAFILLWEKRERLCRAVDALRERLGSDAVRRGAGSSGRPPPSPATGG